MNGKPTDETIYVSDLIVSVAPDGNVRLNFYDMQVAGIADGKVVLAPGPMTRIVMTEELARRFTGILTNCLQHKAQEGSRNKFKSYADKTGAAVTESAAYAWLKPYHEAMLKISALDDKALKELAGKTAGICPKTGKITSTAFPGPEISPTLLKACLETYILTREPEILHTYDYLQMILGELLKEA